jgi:hypothetical protein
MLRKTFEYMAQDPLRCLPESLEDAAKELDCLGLSEVSGIISEYTVSFEPETSLKRCPYQNVSPYSLHPKELKAHQEDWQGDVLRKRRLPKRWWDRTIP